MMVGWWGGGVVGSTFYYSQIVRDEKENDKGTAGGVKVVSGLFGNLSTRLCHIYWRLRSEQDLGLLLTADIMLKAWMPMPKGE